MSQPRHHAEGHQLRRPFSVGRPSQQAVDWLLRDQCRHDVTYREVGATRDRATVAGYRAGRWSTPLGRGDEVFDRAVGALRRWDVHRRAGMVVVPSSPTVEEGATVALGLSLALIRVTAACRVVYVVDEAGCHGFAYGTLPHHPEQGEEAFMVRRSARDDVSFEIRALSRPAHPLARAAGPFGRAIQAAVTGRYLRAMEGWARLH